MRRRPSVSNILYAERELAEKAAQLKSLVERGVEARLRDIQQLLSEFRHLERDHDVADAVALTR